MNVSETYAVSFLESWFQEHHDFFQSHSVVSEFKDSGHGSAYVRLESERCLAEICSWDHASCLDIQIFELGTKESIFPHVGECETKLEFESQLNNFIEWFKYEHQVNT